MIRFIRVIKNVLSIGAEAMVVFRKTPVYVLPSISRHKVNRRRLLIRFYFDFEKLFLEGWGEQKINGVFVFKKSSQKLGSISEV